MNCKISGCNKQLNKQNKSGVCSFHQMHPIRKIKRTCIIKGCKGEINNRNISGLCHYHRTHKEKKPRLKCVKCGINTVFVLSKTRLCLACRGSKGVYEGYWQAHNDFCEYIRKYKPYLLTRVLSCKT
jgi:hypothetical protein